MLAEAWHSSRCHDTFSTAPVVSRNDNASGLEGELFFGSLAQFAVNQIDYKLEETEMSAHCPLVNKLRDAVGVSAALIFVHPGTKGEHQRLTVGRLHGEPLVLS